MIYTVAAFYRFVPLCNLPELQGELLAHFAGLGLWGTLLIAPEGINGTLAGTSEHIGSMLETLNQRCGLERADVKFSSSEERPFNRLKVRIKREIITFKQPQADPSKHVGTYVTPKDWNELLNDPELTILDTRNSYETSIGSFEGSIDPEITNFTEFADYVRKNLDPKKHKKIAMFCTGGIRCEKASSFMLSEGFEEVYHLKGGILKYLEDVPQKESRWNGDCYVFDRRVAVGHGLTSGHFSMCFTCGSPLTPADKDHVAFEDGVACAKCFETTTPSDKERFRMRQQQMLSHGETRATTSQL